MALDIACLNATLTLPIIPVINNMTNIPSHPHYNPNGKALSQLISSSMARSTFSTVDFESFLKMITSSNNSSFDVSTVVKSKPITSTIIYTSITLALFIILSLIFCTISCRKNHQKKSSKRCKCCGPCVPVVLLILVGLIVIGQMIYIAYQIDKTTKNLDKSIKEINQEIYPKEVSFHLEHLLHQMEVLDQYSTQTDSILIEASRSIFIKAFDRILREQYSLDIIRESIVDIDVHMKELNDIMNEESGSLPGVDNLFEEIKNQHQDMIDRLKIPLEELCIYANGSEVEIDKTVLKALDLVHKQLRILIDTIEQDFLQYMTPWQNAMLMKQDLEDRVRWYIRLVGIVLLVLIIIFGCIPISFLVIILLRCCCRYQQQKSSSKYRQSQSSIRTNNLLMGNPPSNNFSNRTLCWMRIFFTPIIIMLVVIILLTGVLYAGNLFVQGACRVAHDDQSFLVPFLLDELLGPAKDNLMVDALDVPTTIITIINDCQNQTHFSEHFFNHHLIPLQANVNQAMNQLNKIINEKFNNSIKVIDIVSDIDLLDNFAMISNSTKIRYKVQQIRNNSKTIQRQFEHIVSSDPVLSANLVDQSIDNFTTYVKEVVQATTDTCPLPLATIYKADTFICHQLASSINGLWFSIFIYMFFIIFGLCICGLYIYKRSFHTMYIDDEIHTSTSYF